VISDLTGAAWLGPAPVAMTAAAAPYVAWLTTTAALCEQPATQARAAAAAYEAAFAMTVPPPMVAANRAQLMSLIATNILGQNTPAIAATEADYGEMWAHDATAKYGYAGASATSATLSPFTPPQQTTNPAGPAVQAAAVAHATGTFAANHAHTTISTVPQLISTVPHALPRARLAGIADLVNVGAPGILQALIGSSPTSALSLLTPYTAALATTNLGLASRTERLARWVRPPPARRWDQCQDPGPARRARKCQQKSQTLAGPPRRYRPGWARPPRSDPCRRRRAGPQPPRRSDGSR
jgi:PPE-repeat protein